MERTLQIIEIIRLSRWMEAHTQSITGQYTSLVQVLEQNARQGQQQPVAEHLEELSNVVGEMPTRELSDAQLSLLESRGVAKLIGGRGSRWLDETIKSTSYDPATTYNTVREAFQRLQQTNARLQEFANVAKDFSIVELSEDQGQDPYIVSVIFRDGASIKNIRDWKKSAADWELIFSGITEVVDERVETVKVVGASNGSIILTLATSVLVTKVLATISKHISMIANDYLDFQLKRQELERSRMMSDAIRDDLDRQENERKEQSRNVILDAISELVPDAKPEALSKLEKAIDKQIKFGESGGRVDFVVPEAVPSDDDLDDDFGEIRSLVNEYQEEAQKTLLLEKKSATESDE